MDPEALHRRLDPARASPAPGLPAASRARRCSRPGSRPRVAPPRAAARRPRRGTGPSGRRRRCSSTRARPRGRRTRAGGRRSRRRRRCAPRQTVIGPVGFAETISTCTRFSRVARSRRRRRHGRRPGSRRAHRDTRPRVSQRLTNPGPAISARSTSASSLACSTSCSAISRGGCFRSPREPHRDVRRVVPVLGVAGALEHDVRARRLAERGSRAARSPVLPVFIALSYGRGGTPARSVSSTSRSTRSTWPARTRTSRTSRSPSTSSRSPSPGSTTRSRRATFPASSSPA